MVPIRYQVVGEEDYALVVDIDANGEFHVSSGTYTSEKPRTGRLTADQEVKLVEALRTLGVPREHAAPAGATAFMAELTVGKENEAVTYSFWEGALEEDEPLRQLVRLIEMV